MNVDFEQGQPNERQKAYRYALQGERPGPPVFGR